MRWMLLCMLLMMMTGCIFDSKDGNDVGNNTISGKVVDGNGVGVSDVYVTCQHLGYVNAYVKLSDVNGDYSFEHLIDGDYVLRFKKENCVATPDTIKVTVDGNERSITDVTCIRYYSVQYKVKSVFGVDNGAEWRITCTTPTGLIAYHMVDNYFTSEVYKFPSGSTVEMTVTTTGTLTLGNAKLIIYLDHEEWLYKQLYRIPSSVTLTGVIP